ncbi:hypothetical protein D3C71_1829240 [compost metagenome]
MVLMPQVGKICLLILLGYFCKKRKIWLMCKIRENLEIICRYTARMNATTNTLRSQAILIRNFGCRVRQATIIPRYLFLYWQANCKKKRIYMGIPQSISTFAIMGILPPL